MVTSADNVNKLTEVNHIWAHAATLRAVVSGEGSGAILQCCMLLADRGMVQGYVADFLVASEKEGRLPMDVENWQHFVAFEWVESEEE